VNLAARLTRIRILQPLRHRDFALLTSGQAVSLIGDGFFFVGLAWQVYLISNEPSALAFVSVAATLPLVIFVLIGGALSDRYDRRRLMIGADIMRGVAIAAIGFLSISGTLELWHMAVGMFLVGAGDAFFNPSSTAIVPDLLPEEDLPQANALSGALRRLMTSLVGPAIAGVLIAALGPGPAFVIDGATFLVSAVAVFLIRTRPAPHPATDAGIRHTIAQVREGFSYVRSKPWIWATLVSAMLSLLVFLGPVEVLMPYLVKNQLGLGPEALGTIFAVGGVGAIIMALGIGHFGLPRKHVTIMYWSWSIGVALMAIYGVMNALWMALLVSLFQNALFELGQVIWTTMLQQRVPRELLGRVSSLDWMLSTALVPLSFALTAPVAAILGAGPTMVLASLLGAVLMASLMLVPGGRDPEREPLSGAQPIRSGQGGEDLAGL
jgi:DHA3 family tetracycline resistance protein-like MFS transporter